MRSTSILRFLLHSVNLLQIQNLIKMRHLNRQWMYLFRMIPFKSIAMKFDNYRDKLTAFEAFWHHLPAQGSDRWLRQRRGLDKDGLSEILLNQLDDVHRKQYLIPTPIGGSEIAVLRGEDKDSTRMKVLRSKLNLDQFDGNIITRWGKMFEPVINQYTEIVFGTSLVETGSVPGLRDSVGFPIQSYSPDGLGIVAIDKFREVMCDTPEYTKTEEYKQFVYDRKESIALFEFKCPWMRIPDGTVPKKYLSQPKMGMSSLSIPDVGIFGDAMFRRCAIGDFAFSRKYDKGMHFGKTSGDPIVMGFVGLYDESKITGSSDVLVCDDNTMRKISGRLFNITQASFKSKGSNFYNALDETRAADTIAHVPIIVACCYLTFSNLLLNEFKSIDVTEKDEFLIIWNVVRRTIKLSVDDARRDMLYELVVGCCRANQCNKTYNYDRINFGADLGITKQPKSVKGGSMKQPGDFDTVPLEKILAKLGPDANIDDPITHEDLGSLMLYATTAGSGIKFYYPDKFCYKPSNRNAEGFSHSGSNHMDIDRNSNDQCRKWLWTNLAEFEDFCIASGYRPLGVIPWKMMKICYTPVYKDDDFQQRNAVIIQEAIDIIQDVRQQTRDAKTKDESKFMSQLLEQIDKKLTRANGVTEDGYSDLFDGVDETPSSVIPFCNPFDDDVKWS